MVRTIAFVQARMGSTRLPGKVLADIQGKPMLQHVVDRTSRAKLVDRVVVATSTATSDDAVAEYCERRGVEVSRGSENDVLDRYYQAAREYQPDYVVRITADCPLIDPQVVDQVISVAQAGDYAYVSNVNPPTFPDGLDVEVIQRDALRMAWHGAARASEREHVTPYLRAHPDVFRQVNVENSEDLSRFRWTVDHPRDLEFVRAVFRVLGHQAFDMHAVLRALGGAPELAALNAGIQRNEGYVISRLNDGNLER